MYVHLHSLPLYVRMYLIWRRGGPRNRLLHTCMKWKTGHEQSLYEFTGTDFGDILYGTCLTTHTPQTHSSCLHTQPTCFIIKGQSFWIKNRLWQTVFLNTPESERIAQDHLDLVQLEIPTQTDFLFFVYNHLSQLTTLRMAITD